MRTMPDNSVYLLLTDPPYGIGEAAGKNKSRGDIAVATDYGNLSWDNSIPVRSISKKCNG
jgi:DNA modification methylase